MEAQPAVRVSKREKGEKVGLRVALPLFIFSKVSRKPLRTPVSGSGEAALGFRAPG